MLHRRLTIVVVLLVAAVPVLAAAQSVRGLVVDVDPTRHVLVLESGGRRIDVTVPAGASIQNQHAQTMTFADIRVGDAIAYHIGRDGRAGVSVSSQFWAPVDQGLRLTGE